MMQYLTTREPEDEMLEVVIASMKAAKAGPLAYAEQLDDGVVKWEGEDAAPAEAAQEKV